MPQPFILRRMLQSFTIITHRICILSLIDTGKSTHLVAIHHKRIAENSFRAVGLGTCKIVQIELGQSPIKIGFSHIGFGTDYLTKVLYRQYIIIKVQRIPTHPHHMVGIHLCLYRENGTKEQDYRQNTLKHLITSWPPSPYSRNAPYLKAAS